MDRDTKVKNNGEMAIDSDKSKKAGNRNSLSEYIIKSGTARDKRLKYDFMPSLLEIIERPSHIAGKIIIIGITLLLIVFLIWAELSEINVIVAGSGSILPEGNIITIKSITGGIVEKINFSEGDYVDEGDVLLTLNIEDIEAEISEIEDTVERLNTEKDIKLKYAENINEQIEASEYPEKYTELVNSIILENKLQLLELERFSGDTLEIMKLQYEGELRARLSEIAEKLENYRTELNRLELELNNHIIKSPAAGYIAGLSVNHKGQVIAQADSLIQIVPVNEPLIFEGYIQDEDIAEIEVGDLAKIKLQAYSYSEYGDIEGKIIYISKTSYEMEGVGNVYSIKVEIDNDELNKNINLISGLSGSVEIDAGTRSVLDYFLEPIVKGLNNSLKER